MRMIEKKIRRQHGISLVELLVAMVVGLMLLTGILQVYVSNHTAASTISGFSGQQENARIALNAITSSLRLAGHYGGVNPSKINTLGSPGITGVGSCNQAWVVDTTQAIRGYDGAAAIGNVDDLPSNCISTDAYVANTDVLALRYASPADSTPIGSLDASTIYLRTAISSGGEIFAGADSGSTTLEGGVDGVGIYNYEYKTELFYVRPCSALNGTACTDGLSSLVRLTLTGKTLTSEVIAEGIEQFQIEYGVDTGADYIADEYGDAASITDWSKVVSAKFSIVVRSEKRDNLEKDAATYSLASGYDYVPGSDVNAYPRKAYTRVVHMRNMTRG